MSGVAIEGRRRVHPLTLTALIVYAAVLLGIFVVSFVGIGSQIHGS